MRKKKDKNAPPIQYSKKILTGMIRLWFVGAVFGMIFVSIQLLVCLLIPERSSSINISLDGILNYIGIPMTGGTIGYLLKSAMENKEKIHHDPSVNDYPT